MKQLLAWLLTAVVFAGLGGIATWLFVHEHAAEEEASPAAASEPSEEQAVYRDENGNVVVRVDEETQHRIGLQTAPVRAASLHPEQIAFGTVQELPSASFTVRAPLAGVVTSAPATAWPTLGEQVAAGATVGKLVPRVGAVERIDLVSRLASAHADVEDARASLGSLQAALAGKRELNRGGQRIVAEQAIQEAQAKVVGEQARLQAAEETVNTLQSALSGTADQADTIPLVVGQQGRIIEVLASPGEAVESGQGLLRVSSFDRLLARVALPAGRTAPQAASATVLVAGHDDRPLPVTRRSMAPQVDPVTGGETWLLEFCADGIDVQPGMPVTARFQLSSESSKGVIVPRGAVVRYVGAQWVYVQSADDLFTRVEVPLSRLTPDGWFVASGLAPDTCVVVEAAQSLLSTELKFQQGGGEEEEE